MCRFNTYVVPEGPPYYANGAVTSKTVCVEHHWTMTDLVIDGLCPLGRIEKAVEEGLAHLAAHSNVSDKHSTAIAEIMRDMINFRRSSNKAEDNLNYLKAYIPIAHEIIKYMNENIK